jgi:manganese-transporting P-type ATPase
MIIDFVGCYIVHAGSKYFFASLEPAEIVTRGRERREARRIQEAKDALLKPKVIEEKKVAEVVPTNGDVKQRVKKVG